MLRTIVLITLIIVAGCHARRPDLREFGRTAVLASGGLATSWMRSVGPATGEQRPKVPNASELMARLTSPVSPRLNYTRRRSQPATHHSTGCGSDTDTLRVGARSLPAFAPTPLFGAIAVSMGSLDAGTDTAIIFRGLPIGRLIVETAASSQRSGEAAMPVSRRLVASTCLASRSPHSACCRARRSASSYAFNASRSLLAASAFA